MLHALLPSKRKKKNTNASPKENNTEYGKKKT
jgi:hypothetical protein